MNESLRLGLQIDTQGGREVDELGKSLARIPPAADQSGIALEQMGKRSRSSISDFAAMEKSLGSFAGATLKGVEAITAFIGAHTLASGSLAKHSIQVDTLADAYRGLRLALSPTLFTAASIGVGILAEETIRLVNIQGKLIEQRAMIAAKGKLSFEAVERVGTASQFSGGDAGQLTGALAELKRRYSDKDTKDKVSGALDSLDIAKYERAQDWAPLLGTIAERFANIADPAARAKAAVDLFGADVAEKVLPQLNQRFADSSKAVDDWGLTLSTTSRNQVYEFSRDIRNFKDDVFGLATGFEALKGKIEQALTVGGAKAYGGIKAGVNWYLEGADKLDERFGTRNPYSINEEAKRGIADSSAILSGTIGPYIAKYGAGAGFAPGVLGDAFSVRQHQSGSRDDLETSLNAARSLETEIKRVLDAGGLTPAQVSSFSAALVGAAQEINAAKAGLKGIDISKRQSEALRDSQELVYRSQFDRSAGRDLRGGILKATTFVDEDGSLQHINLEDATRRNLLAAFATYAQDLNRKTSEEQIKGQESEFESRIRLEEMFWKRRQGFADETSKIELNTIRNTFANENTAAGYARDEALGRLGSLDPRSPNAVRDRLSQIGQRQGIQKDYITSTSLNDAARIERDQQGSLLAVAMALKAGNINQAEASERYRAISAAGGQQGGALNDKFAHDLLMANQEAAKETRDVLRDVLEKQTEAIKNATGGLFDAVTSRQPRAIPDFVKSQALSFGKTIVENIATEKVLPAIRSFLPGTSNPIFKDTFLFDPLKSAGVTLTTAGASLQAAADKLLGGSASNFGTYSVDDNGNPIGGGGTLSAAARSAKGFSSLSSFAGNFGAGASSVFSGNALSILLGENTTGPTTAAGRIGAGIGLGGALAAGGFGIYQGLKQGGAGGDLKAAGSAAGIAGEAVSNIAKLVGAASPLLSAIPIVGSIAAMALPLLGGLFNGPQLRENAINKAISENQYLAPTAINATMSSGGGFADFDSRGNLRTSSFSPYPQTTNGFVWAQSHGTFSSQQPTFYDVPGSQTSQFGRGIPAVAPEVHNHYWSVQAVDAPSFAKLLDTNHMAVGGAAGKALQGAHGLFNREVSRAAKVS